MNNNFQSHGVRLEANFHLKSLLAMHVWLEGHQDPWSFLETPGCRQSPSFSLSPAWGCTWIPETLLHPLLPSSQPHSVFIAGERGTWRNVENCRLLSEGGTTSPRKLIPLEGGASGSRRQRKTPTSRCRDYGHIVCYRQGAASREQAVGKLSLHSSRHSSRPAPGRGRRTLSLDLLASPAILWLEALFLLLHKL